MIVIKYRNDSILSIAYTSLFFLWDWLNPALLEEADGLEQVFCLIRAGFETESLYPADISVAGVDVAGPRISVNDFRG